MIISSKELSVRDIVYRLFKCKWLILAPLIIGVSLTIAYTDKVKYFRSSAIISFNGNYLMDSKDTLFENKAKRLVFSLLYGENLKAITERAYPDVSEIEDPVAFNSRMQSLGNSIELAFRRDNYRALTIAYRGTSPEQTQRVVQATIDTILAKNEEDAQNKLKQSTEFLASELATYKRKLREIEKELFLKGDKVSEIDTDPLLQEVRMGIVEKRKDLKSLSALGYGKSHPKRKTLRVELSGLEDLEEGRINELKSAYVEGQLGEGAVDLSVQNARIMELRRDREALMTAYTATSRELEFIKRRGKVESREDVGLNIVVEEPPRVPTNPITLTSTGIIVMSAFISIALGMGLFTLVQLLDSSVSGIKQLEKVSGLPVIGSVEKMQSQSHRRWHRNLEIGVVCSLTAVVYFSKEIVGLLG